MNQEQARFIILRKIKYSESDLIIHALSVTGAKYSFIARGALKSKKRFGGGILEPTHYVLLTYKSSGEEGRMSTLLEAKLINDFSGIRRGYDFLELALHILDCAGRVSQEGDNDSEFLFNLVGNALKAIETCEDVNLLKLHFYLKFLLQQGVIQGEIWMAPFLKLNMNQSNELKPFKRDAEKHLPMIESFVKAYIKDATL